MFNKLRDNIGYYFLVKKAARVQRNPEFINLNNAKSIAVVANLSNMEKYKVVAAFVNELRQQGKTIFVAAIVENDEFKKFFEVGTSVLLISKKNITCFGKPKNSKHKEFISHKFDILIDTSLSQNITIQHLVALSIASFKVGKYYDNCSYADFMINIKETDTFQFFIEQIKHYLTTINNNE